MKKLALTTVLLGACWADNPHYRPPPDAAEAPDLAVCPSYAAGGGGGLNRPEVLVSGGAYRIGGNTYQAADFYLDVFLVTVKSYRDCVNAGTGGGDAGAGASDEGRADAEADGGADGGGDAGVDAGTAPGGGACSVPDAVGLCNWTAVPGSNDDQPINCVTQAQAQAFCQWAGRRLPGEGEWQYAAAGPRMSAFPWGNDPPQQNVDGGIATQLCWSDSVPTVMTGTCPVGSFDKTLLGAQSCFGVADLSGNLWEWTGSEYHDPYGVPELSCNSESAACSLRGGSWGDADTAFFDTTYRYDFDPSFGLVNFGFRCARSPGIRPE